jgi:hypothetical protein
MKKYFAKYLPVEGNIKDRDYYIDDNNEVWQHKKELCFTPPGRKAILFLCSKEVSLGDEIYYKGFSSRIEKGNFHSIAKSEDGDDFIDITPDNRGIGILINHEDNGLCKPIGEISLKATWVKEGDEFDEDEIHRTETERDYDPEHEEAEYYSRKIKGTDPIKEGRQFSYDPILLKGPCGHFH